MRPCPFRCTTLTRQIYFILRTAKRKREEHKEFFEVRFGNAKLLLVLHYLEMETFRGNIGVPLAEKLWKGQATLMSNAVEKEKVSSEQHKRVIFMSDCTNSWRLKHTRVTVALKYSIDIKALSRCRAM